MQTTGATVRKVVDRSDEIEAAIRSLAAQRVMVGVPAEKAFRPADTWEKEPPPNNAALAYIHENGAPEIRIPPRPFLRPGVQAAQEAITAGLRKAGELALAGDSLGVDAALNAVGLQAVSSVQRKITDGPFAPLSQRTIEARANRRGFKGGSRKGAKLWLKQSAAGQTPDPNLVKPLIDTGKLRQSITYVIRKVLG
jgi:hypothetical protein